MNKFQELYESIICEVDMSNPEKVREEILKKIGIGEDHPFAKQIGTRSEGRYKFLELNAPHVQETFDLAQREFKDLVTRFKNELKSWKRTN